MNNTDIFIYISFFTPAILFATFLTIKYGFKQMRIPIFTTLIVTFIVYMSFAPMMNFMFWLLQ